MARILKVLYDIKARIVQSLLFCPIFISFYLILILTKKSTKKERPVERPDMLPSDILLFVCHYSHSGITLESLTEILLIGVTHFIGYFFY